MATSTFTNSSIYSHLPRTTSIRLLSLLSCQNKSNIRCSLLVVNDLDIAPPYDALSYTWGDPIPDLSGDLRNNTQAHEADAEGDVCNVKVPIFCDGREILVTTNLRNALKMLFRRHSGISSSTPLGGSNLVWIDQLCINQTDNEEKSLQVAIMGDIFSKAQTVFAWAGEGDETTADALTVMDGISSIPAHLHQTLTPDDFANPTAYESKLGIKALSVTHWLGWLTFLHNSYFKRIWIVQEVCLNSNVVLVIGENVLAWNKFASVLSFLMASGWLPLLHTEYLRNKLADDTVPDQYRKILDMNLDSGYSALYLNQTKTNAVAAGRLFSLEALLRNHRGCKATNPVDKVYALLGVSAKSGKPFSTHPEALIPNYDMPVTITYTRVAQSLVQSYEDLRLFSHMESRPLFTKVKGLPSWVPDFSAPLLPSPLSNRQKSWDIGGCIAWKQGSPNLDDSLLDVRGFCVGSVSQTSLSMLNVQNTPLSHSDLPNDQSSSAEQHLISSDEYQSSLCGVALGLNPYYPIAPDVQPHQTRVEVLWRTLIMDTYIGKSPAPRTCGDQFLGSFGSLCMTMLREEKERKEAFLASRGFFRRSISRLRPRNRTNYAKAACTNPHVRPWMNLIENEPAESAYNSEAFERCLEANAARMSNPETQNMVDYTRPFEQYRLEINLCQGQRKLFRTDNGLLGYGPDALKETDEVWVLGGGKVPFALRRVAGKTGYYHLVGECYVHGIMFGEAMQFFDTTPRDIVLK